jgi:ATP-dependent Clp protease ATP-binding subunit ClpA
MSKRKNYKVVSPDLNLVIFLKGFSLEEERKLYNGVRSKFEKAKDPINVESYKEFVVKKFLIDADKFLESLDNNLDKVEVIDSIYESVVSLYPPFSIEFICQDLNTETFFTGVKGNFLKNIRDQFQNSQDNLRLDPNHISVSSIEDILGLDAYLKENIIGQRNAIAALVKSLKLMASGLAKHSSFLFVGPTGVGKTQLGKLLGERFSGNFYKINCAEYAGQHEYAKLIGAPPGYVGHTDKSLLAEKAEQSNRWVFLFDEIEKAHHKLYDFLLSILDDGTCTDNMGTILDFSESIFIFTSNQGTSEIKRDTLGFGKKSEVISEDVSVEIIEKSIKRHFSPEFLNRLDDIIFFKSLTKEEVKKIASIQLDILPIHKTDPLVKYVVKGGYSPEYGARNIARFIKNNVAIKIADAILHKLVPKNDDECYTPRLVNNEVTIINTEKYQASST